VYVSVDGVDIGFEWSSSNTVRLDSVPAGGSGVRIYRQTPSIPAADYSGGSLLSHEDMNQNMQQVMYILEEFNDLTGFEPGVGLLELE
jgi:hypothetical protein